MDPSRRGSFKDAVPRFLTAGAEESYVNRTAALAALLLATASMAGCLGSEDGAQLDAQSGAADEGPSGASNETGSDDREPPSEEGQAGRSSNATANATHNGSWTNATSLILGAQASVGIEAFEAPLPGGSPVEDQVVSDGERCLVGEIGVPEGTTRLSVAIEDETVNPEGPGAGGYSANITGPEGESVYGDWLLVAAPGSQFDRTVQGPTPGTWTVELDPNGATVEQAWLVEVSLEGEGGAGPEALRASTACDQR